MKRIILYLFFSFFAVFLIGCSEQITTENPTSVSNSITVIVGEESFQLAFDDTDESVFDLMVDSEIDMTYEMSDYGPMITEIEDYRADTFHWIGIEKNDDFAQAGLDTIAYEDGDVFEFTYNLASWEQTLTMTFESEGSDYYYFTYESYQVAIDKETFDLDSPIDLFILDEDYIITGTPTHADNDIIYFSYRDIEPTYDGYIYVVIGQNTHHLTYNNEDEQSVFDLIKNSQIDLNYIMTDFGPMITGIGSLIANDFYWIGFTKNAEFAMEGLDTIAYENGDLFEFSQNLVTWEVQIEAELMAIETDHLVFKNGQESFVVYHQDLGEEVFSDDLVIGMIYQIIGIPSDQTTTDTYIFNPRMISIAAISDFTELYQLDVGDVFILEFTVTFVEESSLFGYEIFAEDINGLSSTSISENMAYPSDTDYIFYTIPDDYDLLVGESYYGRFIYQVNAPSTIPQITLYPYNFDGEDIETQVIILR